MAMTKAEKQRMSDLSVSLACEQSMYISEPQHPDLPVPETSEATEGWMYNLSSRRVETARSHSYKHQLGERSERSGWSQRGIALFSTKSRALKALRGELSRGYALTLAELDERIIQATEKEASE